MKLLTKEIKDMLPKLYSTDGVTYYTAEGVPPSKTAICKFFNPLGSWTWYVFEGEEQKDGDWLFFGLVDGFEKELGFFNLKELESLDVGLGLGIERDIHFQPKAIAI